MQENRITVVINKPLGEVFEFTTNPKNTHTWIPSIEEEKSEQYPPKIGTIYKNRGKEPKYNTYKVVEFEKDKKFTLKNLENKYFVRYTYRKINENKFTSNWNIKIKYSSHCFKLIFYVYILHF